jgi:hypothetical protein
MLPVYEQTTMNYAEKANGFAIRKVTDEGYCLYRAQTEGDKADYLCHLSVEVNDLIGLANIVNNAAFGTDNIVIRRTLQDEFVTLSSNYPARTKEILENIVRRMHLSGLHT